MNKVDSFLTTMIILLSLFFVVYKTAEFQFSGIEFERQKNRQLSHIIKQMKLKEEVAALETEQKIKKSHEAASEKQVIQARVQSLTRNIASVEAAKIKIDKKIDANKELMDSSALAESYYKQAKLNCEKYKKEDICTQNIDIVVSQFPETRWAGESLILLSRLYLKTRHVEKAREVMKIIASEFKGDKEIQSKLVELERNKL